MNQRILIKFILLFFIIAAIIVISGLYLFNPAYQVRQVKVASNGPLHYLTRENVVKTIKSQSPQWMHFSINKVGSQLVSYPGVEHVFVQKRWPSQINIKLLQAKPVAYWRDQKHIVTTKGNVIEPIKLQKIGFLPLFKGQKNTISQMISMYQMIQEILKDQKYHVKTLTYQANQWQMKLNNDMTVMLGSHDIRSRLTTYLKVLPKISQNTTYVDMRYPQGFATK